MNKLTFLAALIIFLCSFSGGGYSEQEPIKAEIELIENYEKLEEESIHGRPRMPLNVIYANYSEGYFSIELESGNQASVEIKTMNDESVELDQGQEHSDDKYNFNNFLKVIKYDKPI